MFLRQMCRLTSTIEGLVSKAHCIHVSHSYHASSVKVPGENDPVSHKENTTLSLESLSAEEIISTLKKAEDSIKGSHIVFALHTISNHYKCLPGSEQGKRLLREFVPILVQNKNKFSGQQALDIVKMLDQLGVSKKSQIYSAMILHILHMMNDLSLKSFCEILDITLDNTIDPGLRSDLQAALERKLLVKLSMHFNESDGEFYQYAFHLICQMPQLSDKHNLIGILIEKLCNYSGVIPIDTATLIYESVYPLKNLHLRIKVLNKLQSDLAEQAHVFNFYQVEKIMKLLVEQDKCDQLKDCYNETFVNLLAKRIIDGRFKVNLAVYVSSELTLLRHKSPELLEYCCSVLINESNEIVPKKRRKIMWSLLSNLCQARHKTIFWDEIRDFVSKSASEDHESPTEFVYLVSELLALNWFPNPVVEKICDGSFRPSLLSNPSKIFCRIYQIMKLDTSYDGPLPTDSQVADLKLLAQKSYCIRKNRPFPLLTNLKEGIKDSSCIQTNIYTQFFHELDHVLGFYQDGTPAPISVNPSNTGAPHGVRYIEDLTVPPGAKLVIVHFLPSSWFIRNTHELQGNRVLVVTATELLPYPVVFVDGCTWDELPSDERTSFIMNTIKSKLQPAS